MNLLGFDSLADTAGENLYYFLETLTDTKYPIGISISQLSQITFSELFGLMPFCG